MDDNSIVTQGPDILGTLRGVFGDLLNYQGLSKAIDAESARPWTLSADNNYAIGPGNQLFVRGQAAGVLGGAVTPQSAAQLQQLIWYAILAGGLFLAFRAFKG